MTCLMSQNLSYNFFLHSLLLYVLCRKVFRLHYVCCISNRLTSIASLLNTCGQCCWKPRSYTVREQTLGNLNDAIRIAVHNIVVQKAMDMGINKARCHPRTSAVNNLAVWLLFSEMTKYTVFYEFGYLLASAHDLPFDY